jgi:hypothetical protein
MTNAILERCPDLLTDLCRYLDGLCSERDVRKRHKLDEAEWQELASDEVVEAVEEERRRRVRDGSLKRERAQKHIVRAPDVLAGIMDDTKANPRHVIDAVKVLDGLAANGPQAVPTGDRFIISINLGGDIETYSKSFAIDPNDTDPNQVDATALAAITAKKTDGGDGGNHL